MEQNNYVMAILQSQYKAHVIIGKAIQGMADPGICSDSLWLMKGFILCRLPRINVNGTWAGLVWQEESKDPGAPSQGPHFHLSMRCFLLSRLWREHLNFSDMFYYISWRNLSSWVNAMNLRIHGRLWEYSWGLSRVYSISKYSWNSKTKFCKYCLLFMTRS